jgi:omega-amidase
LKYACTFLFLQINEFNIYKVMKISVIQSDLVWENKSANLQHLEQSISAMNNKTDIVILPEMFNTGFSMKPGILGELMDGTTLEWMKKMACNGNFGVCGSYIISAGSGFFNRWIFVSAEGDLYYYDKRHLFSMGGEDKLFSQGKSRLVFTYRGTRISPYICYDLRFPVWSRNRNDTDLIIYAANWPESRREVWNTLLKARAIENQCFVAGCNRIGTDGSGIKYIGESAIIGPRGEIISSGAADEECTLSADLSLSELNDFRNKFPAFNDADEFSVHL